MKTGIFGGTFNPIHNGHLIIAEHACDALGLNRLLIVPAAIPPHKQNEKIIGGKHRMKMAALAIKENTKFEISDIELRKHEVSYTIETLRMLQAREEEPSEYYLIIGSDMVPELHLWKEIDKLMGMCTFVVAVRPCLKKEDLKKMGPRLSDELMKKLMRHTLENPMVDISSTDIRKWVREGRSIHYMVPEVVEKYILENGLYRDQ